MKPYELAEGGGTMTDSKRRIVAMSTKRAMRALADLSTEVMLITDLADFSLLKEDIPKVLEAEETINDFLMKVAAAYDEGVSE